MPTAELTEATRGWQQYSQLSTSMGSSLLGQPAVDQKHLKKNISESTKSKMWIGCKPETFYIAFGLYLELFW